MNLVFLFENMDNIDTSITIELATKIAKEYKDTSVKGRYITIEDLEKFLIKLNNSSKVSFKIIGKSEENRNIYQIKIGKGSKKILIWTQMHGNECTGTKSAIDLINFINTSNNEIIDQILTSCTIKIIPILNPDGAKYFTRFNANKIDLNRDAVERKAKESILLRDILDDFNPEFCFNLHDQRTIFGVEGTKNPATISFLAPSEEETRKVTPTRKKTMNVIVAMNSLLQQIIPNHIGRYTDTFYPKATGDNFQKLGYSTVLIESGHYKDDYQREKVREFTFISILQGLYHISLTNSFCVFNSYFKIPENNESFRDVLYRYQNKPDEAFQFEEILQNSEVKFIPKKVNIDISKHFFHKEIDFVR